MKYTENVENFNMQKLWTGGVYNVGDWSLLNQSAMITGTFQHEWIG